MAISRTEVEKVSLLGRLLLSEDELEKMTTQLGPILQYMELLAEVETDGVEPMAHALDVRNVFGDDAAGESLPADRALGNAPARDGDFFKVPKVIGDA